MKHGALSTPSTVDVFQQLNNKLDSQKKEMLIDLIGMPASEFMQLTRDFSRLFNTFDSMLQHHPDEALKTIWLYIALSHYVEHWANDPRFIDKDLKLNAMRTLNGQFFPILCDFLKKTNTNADHERKAPHCHQKLLHIWTSLYSFAHILIKNGMDSKTIINELTFHQNDKVLDISRKKASAYRNNRGGTSLSEAQNNQILLDVLGGTELPIFIPLKKATDSFYIDTSTGLEYDFPLSGHITLETDGKEFHSYAGKHDIIHSFKANVSRESGWTRIALPPNQASISNMAKLFLMRHTQEYGLEYDKLMTLWKTLKIDIASLQQEMNTRFFPQETKEQHLQHLQSLLADEQTIRQFVSSRPFERMLAPVLTTQDSSIINIYGIYKENLSALLTLKTEQADIKNSLLATQKELSIVENEILSAEKGVGETTSKLTYQIDPRKEKYIARLKQFKKEENVVNINKTEDFLIALKKEKAQNKTALKNFQHQLDTLSSKFSVLERKKEDLSLQLEYNNKKIEDIQKILTEYDGKINSFFKKALPTEQLKALTQKIKANHRTNIHDFDRASSSCFNRTYTPDAKRARTEKKVPVSAATAAVTCASEEAYHRPSFM